MVEVSLDTLVEWVWLRGGGEGASGGSNACQVASLDGSTGGEKSLHYHLFSAWKTDLIFLFD